MKKALTWDDAMAALAQTLAAATVPQRTTIWNRLQRLASDAAGLEPPQRLPWPQAFLQLTPGDVVEVVTGDLEIHWRHGRPHDTRTASDHD